MRKIKNIILLTGLLFLFGLINAQEPFAEKSLPVSYQYGNIPVSLTTGALSINIPLWNVNSGNLSVPVSASYSTNGLRTSDTPSELGLHWRLNAGGSIVQIVKGRYNYTLCPENQHNLENPDNFDFMSSVLNGDADAEPDIFKVNAPGLQVDFMLAEDDSFLKLTENDIKIEFTDINESPLYPNISKGFKITSSNGTKYYFNRVKSDIYSNPDNSHHVSYINNIWYLTKIENADNTNSVIFNYSEHETDAPYDLPNFSYGEFYAGTSDDTELHLVSFIETVKLISIESENETVFFNYDNLTSYESPYDEFSMPDYPDFIFNKTEQFLQTIEIKNNKDDIIKNYEFDYDVNNYNRVFLKEISEISSNDNYLPPYKFKYINPEATGVVFDDKSDCWGYRNYSSFNNIHRIIPSGDSTGLLKEVAYPMGGYTKYYYESNKYCFDDDVTSSWYNENWKNILNDYSNVTNFDSLRGGGYRIKKIENYTGNTVSSKVFEYIKDEKSSGRLTAYPQHEIEYDFWIFNSSNSTWDGEEIEIFSTNNFGIEQGYVTYEKITIYEDERINDPLGDNFGKSGKTEYYYDVQAPEYSEEVDEDFPYELSVFSNEEANLLKKKVVYNNNNDTISKQIFNHSVFANGSKKRKGLKLVGKRYIPEYPYEDAYRALYDVKQKSIKLINQHSNTYATDGSSNNIESNIQYSYSRNGEVSKYPLKITKTESNGSIIETKLYYPEDIEFDGDPVIELMIKRNILSPVLKKEIFKNGVKLSGELTEFKFHITQNEDTLIVPAFQRIWENNFYKIVNVFDSYTDKGNLLTSWGTDYVPISVIYNSDETHIIANVINSKEGDIFHDDLEDLTDNYSTNAHTGKYSEHITGDNQFAGVHDFNTDELASLGKYIYSAWLNTTSEGVKFVVKDYPNGSGRVEYTVPNTGGNWEYHQLIVETSSFSNDNIRCEIWAAGNDALVDNVRFHRINAFMSSATYEPLVGKTSETDANGISIYYEYDSFGRLIKIYDRDKKLIKKNEYNIDKTEFSVSGANELILNCTEEFMIETSETNKTVNYEWFDDFCGGNTVGTNDIYSITPTLTTENKSYFARIIIDGVCSGCIEHSINVVEPYIELPAGGDYEGIYYVLVVATGGETINAGDLYHGCNDLNISFQDDGYNGTDWLSIDYNNIIIEPCTDTNDNGPCFGECRETLVTIEDTEEGVSVIFVIRQDE